MPLTKVDHLSNSVLARMLIGFGGSDFGEGLRK